MTVSQNRPAFEERVALSGVPGVPMSIAQRFLDHLDSCSDAPERAELLAVASFFLRLATALLLEKDFPALPEGLEILLPAISRASPDDIFPAVCSRNRRVSCASRLRNCA